MAATPPPGPSAAPPNRSRTPAASDSGHEALDPGIGEALDATADADVTEPTISDAAIRGSEERLRRIIDGLDAIVVAQEAPGGPLAVSQRVASILGYEPGALATFNAWNAIVHLDDLARGEAAWNDASNAWDLEYRVRHASGRWVWIADRGVRRLGEGGEVVGLFSTLTDITARREAEALAARLTRLNRAAGEVDRVAAKALDRDTLFREACRVAVAAGDLRLAWIGTIDHEAPGRAIVVEASAGEAVGFLEGYRAVLDPGTPWSDRVASRAVRENRTILVRQGDPVPEDIRLASERFGFGAAAFVPLRRDEVPNGVVAIYRGADGDFAEAELALLERIAEDVSHRLAVLDQYAAARLRAARDRLLVEESADGIMRLGLPDARILDANPAAAAMLRTTVGELLGTRITERFFEGDPAGLRGVDIVASGETAAFERRLLAVDGREVIAAGRARQLPDGTLLVSLRDVTAERALEEQLRQSQRLEAVGLLAGGIAHDFNNLLLAIAGYTGLVRETLEPDAPQQRDLAEIETAAGRASALTRQLLLFARHRRLEPTVFEAASAIERLVPMLRRLLGEHIEIVVTPPSTSANVRVDAGEFEQVIVNLAVNARDAMPSGGRLDIAVAAVRPGPLDADRPEVVRITVRDTGIGMDEAVLARVFTPFFTTKPVGQGTGLGLATVHGLVTASGGHITVDSAPGRGTTFTIELPLVEPPPPGAATAAEPPQPSASRRILLVEDDAAVRAVLGRVLVRQGHQVTSAASGVEALELAARGAFDLLVTDVRMPGLQGPDVARRVQAVLPGLPVILMSGFDAESALEAEAIHPAVHLQKPFTPEAIAAAIERLVRPGS